MKPTRLVLFLGVLALASPAFADDVPAAAPLVLQQPGEAAPFWRDARSFDASGEASPPLAPSERETLRSLLARPADGEGCIRVGSGDSPEYVLGPHRPSYAGEGPKLTRLMRAATWAVVARVASASPGISDAGPATLFEVAVESVLRGAAPFPGGRHFVLVPTASFALAGKRVCKTSDVFQMPAVGERVLLFVSDVRGAAGEVLRICQYQLVRLPEKGDVRFPWTLDTVARNDVPKETAALVDYLRELAKSLDAEAGSGAAAAH